MQTADDSNGKHSSPAGALGFVRRRPLVAVGLAIGAALPVLILAVDKPLLLALHRLPPAANRIAWSIGEAGVFMFWVAPLLLGAVILAWRGRSRGAALCLHAFCAAALAGIIVNVFKVLLGRGRPSLLIRDGFYGFDFLRLSSRYHSFPSGHSSVIGAIIAVGHLARPRWSLLWWVLLAVIAFCRVPAGSHYLSDVLVGAYVGVVTAHWLEPPFVRLAARFEKRTRRGRHAPG